jgi:competence protein CoiA
MKFSLVDGQRQEAHPGLLGKCPACDHPMIAKCGKQRVWHWAHQSGRLCDPWWENEGEWHRAWKAEFPDAWQEVVHVANDGTKHIADIKTEHGWVIELQHSRISPEERRTRDAFYRELVWVVDGTGRKRDAGQLARAWNNGMPLSNAFPVRRLYADDCVLLREWTDSQAPIFIDLGDGEWLWWILPGRFNGCVYVAQFPRAVFIHIHRSGVVQVGLDFAGLVRELSGLVARFEEGYIRLRRV